MTSPTPTCGVTAEPLALSARVACRLLPWSAADGPTNMSADEALLESAAAGVASLRFYGWSTPTLSLGYFQPQAARHNEEVFSELPYVRRPSGGDALVHDHEVTYALALPAQLAGQSEPASNWLYRMHGVIAHALSDLGVATDSCKQEKRFSPFLCFAHHACGDLLIGSAKVVGSAQRRHRGAFVQHGAVLLARSPHTPSLPGIVELTGKALTAAETCAAVMGSFARITGCTLEPGEWEAAERQRVQQLEETKYRSGAWNDKR